MLSVLLLIFTPVTAILERLRRLRIFLVRLFRKLLTGQSTLARVLMHPYTLDTPYYLFTYLCDSRRHADLRAALEVETVDSLVLRTAAAADLSDVLTGSTALPGSSSELADAVTDTLEETMRVLQRHARFLAELRAANACPVCSNGVTGAAVVRALTRLGAPGSRAWLSGSNGNDGSLARLGLDGEVRSWLIDPRPRSRGPARGVFAACVIVFMAECLDTDAPLPPVKLALRLAGHLADLLRAGRLDRPMLRSLTKASLSGAELPRRLFWRLVLESLTSLDALALRASNSSSPNSSPQVRSRRKQKEKNRHKHTSSPWDDAYAIWKHEFSIWVDVVDANADAVDVAGPNSPKILLSARASSDDVLVPDLFNAELKQVLEKFSSKCD